MIIIIQFDTYKNMHEYNQHIWLTYIVNIWLLGFGFEPWSPS
jgi:hypothetical protein